MRYFQRRFVNQSLARLNCLLRQRRQAEAEISGRRIPILQSLNGWETGGVSVVRAMSISRRVADCRFLTPNQAHAKALECEQKARATRDAGVIRMYTEPANQWRELADQIDGNKR